MAEEVKSTPPHPLFTFISRSYDGKPTPEKAKAFDDLEGLLTELEQLRANQRTGRIIHGDA
jgi:hypothetical protein